MTDSIDPNLLAKIRLALADPPSGDDMRVRRCLESLAAHSQAQHDAVVQYARFERCNLGDAASGIIWLQERLYG